MLPSSIPLFLDQLDSLQKQGLVDEKSKLLFVDDGSADRTWEIVSDSSKSNERILGISLSRNRGHQNALLAGLMEARDMCDAAISIDCDGQDDISVTSEMIRKFHDGADVVYGVRCDRSTDAPFKRLSAEAFYKLLSRFGAEVIFNHADYRLMSARALDGLSQFGEVNLFLRGLIPLVGFPYDVVEYERHERFAGSSHYPISKMLALAIDGITSLSVKPMRIIMGIGSLFFLFGLALVIYAIASVVLGTAVAGWASTVCIISVIGGLQLLALGVIGEYVGKIYLETKARPRYIIKERIGFV